jgi:hypothetical protein
MSRYSTSARNLGSTQVAFGFLIGFDLGVATSSSWLERVRDISVLGPVIFVYPPGDAVVIAPVSTEIPC